MWDRWDGSLLINVVLLQAGSQYAAGIDRKFLFKLWTKTFLFGFVPSECKDRTYSSQNLSHSGLTASLKLQFSLAYKKHQLVRASWSWRNHFCVLSKLALQRLHDISLIRHVRMVTRRHVLCWFFNTFRHLLEFAGLYWGIAESSGQTACIIALLATTVTLSSGMHTLGECGDYER